MDFFEFGFNNYYKFGYMQRGGPNACVTCQSRFT